jgi:DNA-binding CsgD family transcriptional regulator
VEALELFRTLGDDDLAALTLMHLGELALFAEGDHELASRLYEESLALFRKIGGTWGSTWCLWGLGSTALYCGDHELAKGIFTEALVHARELENPWLVASLLEGLAGVITAHAQAERAATLWGAAEILREEVAAPMSAYEQAAYERAVGAARAQLDETAFAAAWQEGRAMSLEQATEYALSEESEEPQTVSPQAPPADLCPPSLTPREREVATLLSRGLTNRQIAHELHLSRRTVDTHVGKILHKLGLDSREQVATWWEVQHPLPEEAD